MSDLELARLRLAAGHAPDDLGALPARARTYLDVATRAGAPLVDALDAARAVDDDRRVTDRAVAVAAAQGRAVSRGLTVAPLVLVPLLSRALDLDLVGYHRTPVGALTGTLGLALLAVGAVGARAVIRQVGRAARPVRPRSVRLRALGVGVVAGSVSHPVVGLVVAIVLWRRPVTAPTLDPRVAEAAELAAVGVAGGAGVPTALREAADDLPDLAVPLRRLALDLERDRPPPASAQDGLGHLPDVLATAEAVGAPVGPALRRFAAEVRADERARVLAAAERLPVRLTFPTALGSLPGVLLLIGAPIVHGALTATVT